MAAATASASSLSAIVAPPSSSSSFSLLPTDHHSFTHFQFPKPKPIKSLTLKVQNFTLSPLPLLLSSPLCRSSADYNDTEEGENPDEEEQEEGDESEEPEEDEVDKISGVNSPENCKLYVGNLSYTMTFAELSEAFAEAGQVKFAEIIYDRVTDRSRGFGFVTMGSLDEAKKAVRMFDGSQIGGRTVKVNFPEVPRGEERKVMGPNIRVGYQSFIETPHKIYAGNLGWDVTSQLLKDVFAEQPGYMSAKVIYDRETGRSRGFGFISFSSAEAAESALAAMNGMELEGRPLRLNMASDRARSNTEASGEQSEVVSSISI